MLSGDPSTFLCCQPPVAPTEGAIPRPSPQTPGLGGYAASKHAILGLTKIAAIELGDKNIRVVSISPLSVDTPMITQALQFFNVTPEKSAATLPFKRSNTTDEMARAVMFLASSDATSLGGMDLDVTGGWLAK